MAQRGAYAKGIAKREEILRAALEVVARSGFSGASVRTIADAVGLSQAGLLHYFDSKQELFTAILRARNDRDRALAESLLTGEPPRLDELAEAYVGIVRHNAEVPGLVRLFSRLAVDASDPPHPAHRYFLERGEALREVFIHALERGQREGTVTAAIPADSIARILQAVSDGVQLQWLLDPAVDMAGVVADMFALLAPGPPPERNPAPQVTEP
jgi:AcrR family transcriptional regulator